MPMPEISPDSSGFVSAVSPLVNRRIKGVSIYETVSRLDGNFVDKTTGNKSIYFSDDCRGLKKWSKSEIHLPTITDDNNNNNCQFPSRLNAGYNSACSNAGSGSSASGGGGGELVGNSNRVDFPKYDPAKHRDVSNRFSTETQSGQSSSPADDDVIKNNNSNCSRYAARGSYSSSNNKQQPSGEQQTAGNCYKTKKSKEMTSPMTSSTSPPVFDKSRRSVSFLNLFSMPSKNDRVQVSMDGGLDKINKNATRISRQASRGNNRLPPTSGTAAAVSTLDRKLSTQAGQSRPRPVSRVPRALGKSSSQPIIGRLVAGFASKYQAAEPLDDLARLARIEDWVRNQDSISVEPPESPVIFEEEPSQTDTAIHIVYEGEWRDTRPPFHTGWRDDGSNIAHASFKVLAIYWLEITETWGLKKSEIGLNRLSVIAVDIE